MNYTSRESGPLVSSAANAPVFSLADVFFGQGEVGGSLAKIRAQGTIAGSAAVKILDGSQVRTTFLLQKCPTNLSSIGAH